MGKKIIFWLFFPLLIIAFLLHTLGVDHLDFTDGWINYVKYVSVQFNQWSDFRIPEIPLLQKNNDGGWWEVLGAVIAIANFFINLYNVVIAGLNLIIQLLLFIAAAVKCVFSAPEIIVPSINASVASFVSLWV